MVGVTDEKPDLSEFGPHHTYGSMNSNDFWAGLLIGGLFSTLFWVGLLFGLGVLA